jgi:hypothetical protein
MTMMKRVTVTLLMIMMIMMMILMTLTAMMIYDVRMVQRTVDEEIEWANKKLAPAAKWIQEEIDEKDIWI